MTRIAAVKRCSLAGLSEGWGDECYAYVRPGSYEDMLAVDDAEISTKPQREQIEFQTKFVTGHWLSGKIKIFEDGKFRLVDMEAGDCAASRAISDKLYADIMGIDLDPKDLAALQAAAHTSETPSSSSASTETQSSETSAQPERTSPES